MKFPVDFPCSHTPNKAQERSIPKGCDNKKLIPHVNTAHNTEKRNFYWRDHCNRRAVIKMRQRHFRS